MDNIEKKSIETCRQFLFERVCNNPLKTYQEIYRMTVIGHVPFLRQGISNISNFSSPFFFFQTFRLEYQSRKSLSTRKFLLRFFPSVLFHYSITLLNVRPLHLIHFYQLHEFIWGTRKKTREEEEE